MENKNSKETISNNQQKAAQIKCLIKEVLYNSVAQAVIKIFQTPYKVLKIYLFACVIASSGIASYLVVESIFAYLKYEVISSTSTISETFSLFPKITICNQNFFTSEFGLEFLKNTSQYYYQMNMFDAWQISSLNRSEIQDRFYDIDFLAKYSVNDHKFSELTRKALSHGLEDMLTSCSFNQAKCTSKDFEWTFNSQYGNCFVFNADSSKKLIFSGPEYGLNLEIYINFHQNLTLFNSFQNGAGALVILENSTYLDYQNYEIQIAPAHKTSVSVKRRFEFHLPKPYSECDINNKAPARYSSHLYNLFLNSNYAYSRQACFSQCYQNALINKCNCTDASVVSLFDALSCNKNLDCLLDFLIFEFSDSYVNDNCLNLCPLECNSTIYSTELSVHQLIGDKYIYLINESLSLSSDFASSVDSTLAKNSFARINIYYQTLSYSFSSDSPQLSAVSFLASIGGNLGLFLGVSVFSLIEIFQMLIEIFFINIESKKALKIQSTSVV